jgi:DNA-binding response OmpR family regulator
MSTIELDRSLRSGGQRASVHGGVLAWVRRAGDRVVKRVLIVEDEQDVASLVADVLGLEGFESRVASGETALDDALSFRPDVVLLDLMMPVVDGFEVARRLGSNSTTQTIPIVVMTAMHDPVSRATEVGTKHYLAKPFDIGQLIRTVELAASA